jgi:ribosomal protein S18 acetylase RimI-like enzyme
MTDFTLRSLHPEDLDRVVAIDTEAVGRSRRMFFEKRLAVALEAPDSLVTAAALLGDKLIGFAFVLIEDGAFGVSDQVGVVDVVGVDPGHQKKGVGHLMMEGLEARLKKKGIKQVNTVIAWSETQLVGYFASAGFQLSPSLVFDRQCEMQPSFEAGDPEMERYQDGANNDYTSLFRDTVPVRSMRESDLPEIVQLDNKLTGENRSAFYRRKVQEMLRDSGIRVSLVAEQDGVVVGFAMVRLDYGEFGRIEPSAVLDTIGVSPYYADAGVGTALLSQLQANLAGLQVNSIQTQVSWDNNSLLKFLNSNGFSPTQDLVLTKQLA